MIAFGVLEHTPNSDGSEIVSDLQSATKWVETLHPKVGFFTFYQLQKEEI